MTAEGCDVLFLADRLTNRDEIQALRGLVDRLESVGHSSSVLCLSAVVDHGIADLTECPGLGRRWQRPWAVRGLDLEPSPTKPRIMHVLSGWMGEVALEIAERWRIPYLLAAEDFPPRRMRIRLSRAWCRGIVVANRELAEALRRDFAVPSGMIQLIAGGLAATLNTGRPGGPGRVPVVGASGPLVAGSGFSTFLNAARKVVDVGHDAEFLIAGQGDDEGDLRRRAERLRIAERLTFADDLPVGLSFWDVLDVYCQASVVPTVGRPLVQAMANGVPSIASDVEGLRSIVKDGESGLVVPPGDASALALAIVELLQQKDRAQSLGEAGRRRVSIEFHPDREADRLNDLYRQVVADGLGPRDSSLAIRPLSRGADGSERAAIPSLDP